MTLRLTSAATAALMVAAVLSGCASGTSPAADEVRLGYFPNMTHAPALIGVEQGYFAEELADAGAGLTVQTFNSGSDTITALLGGGLDATFIGPLPSLLAYGSSRGEGIRVVSGSTIGGAALVVQPSIGSLDDLVGQRLATPGLGNTQDVAARSYLADQGFTTDLDGGGDIFITPQSTGQTLQTFATGEIAAAWVPEPYVSLLVEQGGTVLVDETDLWEEGEFVTTQLVVRAGFLRDHPDLVEALIEATVSSIDYIDNEPELSRQIVSDALFELTQSRLSDGSFESAWQNLEFTVDPVASSLAISADRVDQLGLLTEELPPVNGIYDLSILNTVLARHGRDPVAAP